MRETSEVRSGNLNFYAAETKGGPLGPTVRHIFLGSWVPSPLRRRALSYRPSI